MPHSDFEAKFQNLTDALKMLLQVSQSSQPLPSEQQARECLECAEELWEAYQREAAGGAGGAGGLGRVRREGEFLLVHVGPHLGDAQALRPLHEADRQHPIPDRPSGQTSQKSPSQSAN